MTAEPTRPGPLAGIRIVDLTSVVFGSYATQMLGDLGADIIKVEFAGGRRGQGGDIIRWGGKPPEGMPADLGPIFMTCNRNKRSWLLDLRQEQDAADLREIIATADVFVATVRPAGLARIGFDPESVRAIRPDIIYVQGNGYGSDGPYAGEPAYDDLIQAACGLADLMPRVDGDPAPRYIPSLVADKVSGLFMAQAILAALFHRQRTGEGQDVEVPMYECMTSFNLVEHLFGHVYDPPTGPWAYPRVATSARKPFTTRDGAIGILPYTDEQWVQFFTAAGMAEVLTADPRFVDYRARTENSSALYQLVDTITPARTSAEWIALLRPLGVPVVEVNRLDDLPGDPHLSAVGFFERHEHPHAGPYRQMRPPVRYTASPCSIRRHPPRLGEHNDELAAEARALREQRA